VAAMALGLEDYFYQVNSMAIILIWWLATQADDSKRLRALESKLKDNGNTNTEKINTIKRAARETRGRTSTLKNNCLINKQTCRSQAGFRGIIKHDNN